MKFVLGPTALYEVSEERSLTTFIDPGEPFGATITAVAVGALYALALTVIYRLARRRLLRHDARERAANTRMLLVAS